MNVHILQSSSNATLAESLARFEEQFTYPLGPGRSFRISHGADYTRFFRAQGDAACFVAERDGKVLGVIALVLRKLRLPDGTETATVYLGDLKIAADARGGHVLARVASVAKNWVNNRARTAFGVVMDGTLTIPASYTGRVGIPLFQEVGKIAIFRIPATYATSIDERPWTSDETRGSQCFLRLNAGCYAALSGSAPERSEMPPLWLQDPNDAACGRLEDTRRAKRLIADDGVEMLSSHLSCFAYANLRASVDLVRAALKHTAQIGLKSLFVAIPAPNAQEFHKAIGTTDVVAASATVFGVGIEPGTLWNINTAEI